VGFDEQVTCIALVRNGVLRAARDVPRASSPWATRIPSRDCREAITSRGQVSAASGLGPRQRRKWRCGSTRLLGTILYSADRKLAIIGNRIVGAGEESTRRAGRRNQGR
jgi:hypothetical protein